MANQKETYVEDANSGSDVWRDFIEGYRLPDEPHVHPNLTLNTESDSDLDPITYEVLRHRLWTINFEHGETVTQITGSPVVYYGQDFNPSIMTETGEIVFGGPYIDFFTPMSEPICKWILENYSDGSPGIEPGDVFMNNDPWIGAAHQSDVSLCMPVFHDGELFCWLIDTLHQYDIGGETPGSFCSQADDIFDEPVPIPPIKIVENDTVREDLKYMYLRHSRLPHMMNLDFGAQLAALRETRSRLKDTIEGYGHKTVKGAMREIINDSERAFLERISDIPNGTWRSRGYETGSLADGANLHKGIVKLMKEGDTLHFSTEGTDPNDGVVNVPYLNFRAAISTVLNPLMHFDQLWVPSGAYRHIEIEPNPGSRYHAEHPSAVSASSSMSIQHALTQIHDAVTRMMCTSEETRNKIISDQANGTANMTQAGIDQWGNPFGTINLDVMGTAFPARSNRDGVDAGGHLLSPKGFLPNIEQNEQDYPLLYLNRTFAKDAAGHGKYRGGAGLTARWIPHNTDNIETTFSGTGDIAPLTMGIGTYPGAAGRPRVARDTDVNERFQNGRVPTSFSEFSDEFKVDQFPTKAETDQGPTDVFEVRYSSTAGIKDPIQREPRKVLSDISDEIISPEVAYEIYGVVIESEPGDRRIQQEETKSRREEIRQERLNKSSSPPHQEEI